MSKKRWIAGYGSPEDWYIVPNTPEKERKYSDFDGGYYDTFLEAKRALIETAKERINSHRHALKYIRSTRKPKQQKKAEGA